MDLPVLFAAAAAHRDHVRPIRKIHVKFLLKGLAKLVASHLLDQLRKRGAVGYLAQRKAAGPADPWIVFLDRRARFGLDELWNNQKIEWLTRKRRVPKSLQIEHRKHWPTLHEEAGISSALPLDESPYYSSATRTRVAMMRLPATNVPRNVPETFDSPPTRRRWSTGISRTRRPQRAAFICISRFQP